MEEAKKNMTHWLIGGILLFVGVMVVVALVIIYSQADSVSTTTTVNNVNPNIDSKFISAAANGGGNDYTSGGIGLTAGTTKTVHVNGVVSDANGANDINVVNVKFFRTAQTNACSVDNNDCYSVTSCPLSNTTATTKDYDCAVVLQFYADATDTQGPYASDTWTAYITVLDLNSGSDNDTAATVEINTLLGLTIPDSIVYNGSGSLTNNESTTQSNNEEMVILQQGNDEADVTVLGTDMSCTGTGSIPKANQEWSLTDVGYASGTDLTASAVDTDLNVGYRTIDGTPLNKTLYWNISVPYAAVGTCTGNNTIVAIAH